MKALSLEHAVFEAVILDAEPSANGSDRCEFRFSSHPSIAREALAKSASGGELSRISLAAAVVNPSAMPSTIIFDEADVGGAVAARVGEKFSELAVEHQVLCITHLAQIAGYADHQWMVSKTASADSVSSSVRALTHEERVREIARMLGGNKIAEAEEMLARKLLKR